MLGILFFIHMKLVWSQDKADPAKGDKTTTEVAKTEPPAAPAPTGDPSGANTGKRTDLGDDPKLEPVEIDPKNPNKKDEAYNKLVAETKFLGDQVGHNKIASNMMWTLLTGFLVMFMQAGFALVETGLTRGKNVAHTMAMNVFIYATGMLGFWICGFAFMYGGRPVASTWAAKNSLDKRIQSPSPRPSDWGLIGYEGFFLMGKSFDSGVMTLFLFQMVFMDTAATIPTGALAERWKFSAFTSMASSSA